MASESTRNHSEVAPRVRSASTAWFVRAMSGSSCSAEMSQAAIDPVRTPAPRVNGATPG